MQPAPGRGAEEFLSPWRTTQNQLQQRDGSNASTHDIDVIARIGDGEKLSVVREAESVDCVSKMV